MRWVPEDSQVGRLRDLPAPRVQALIHLFVLMSAAGEQLRRACGCGPLNTHERERAARPRSYDIERSSYGLRCKRTHCCIRASKFPQFQGLPLSSDVPNVSELSLADTLLPRKSFPCFGMLPLRPFRTGLRGLSVCRQPITPDFARCLGIRRAALSAGVPQPPPSRLSKVQPMVCCS